MTLATIACPSIIIDSNCLTTAVKILDWMCVNGNMVADSRRSDLAELQRVALAIKTMLDISMARTDQQALQDTNWLWTSLDLGEMTRSSATLPSIMPTDFNMPMLDSMLDDQWLWAESETEIQGTTAL